MFNLELQILQLLLPHTEGAIFAKPPVTIKPAESQLPSKAGPGLYALIAIIAREAGFVFEFDHEPVKNWNDCGSPAVNFYAISWQHFPADRPEQGSIHYFGRHSSYFQHSSSVLPIEEITDAPASTQLGILKSIYGVSPSIPEFVNLLATVSPYDDFVETFRLKVLNDSGLQHMYVAFSDNTKPTPDIMSNLTDGSANSKLYQKYACMSLHIDSEFGNQPR